MLQLPELRAPAPPAPPRRRWWQSAVAVRALPPVLLLVLGLLQLSRNRPLWYDEAYTRLAASVPLSELVSGMWHRTGVISYLRDVPPSFNGPFYALMHPWVAVFGTSAFALRLPSLLCAAVAAGVVAELARRLAGPGPGLLCGLLLASGPLMVAETTQARGYGPALLAVCLCALWLHAALVRGAGLRRPVAAAVVAGLLHWFTVPVVVGLAVWAWRRGDDRGRRAARALLLACGPTALLVGWSMAGGTYGAPTPVPVGVTLPWRAVHDWALGQLALVAGILVAAGLGLLRSPHRRLLLCWGVLPLVLITALELVRPSYFPRYLLFTLTGVVLAAALGVGTLRRPAARRTAAGLLLALSLLGGLTHVGDGAREPTPAVLALLASEQQAGQPIVPSDGRVSLDLMTYLSQQPRLRADLVLPPVQFTDQTTSSTVWLVRVVLHQNSLAVVKAEQRLVDAGWTEQSATTVTGTTTDLRVERWTR